MTSPRSDSVKGIPPETTQPEGSAANPSDRSRHEKNFFLIHQQNHQINRNKLFNVSFMSAQSKHD
jgi:hypothetical protein